ncbi:MAG: membrane protein insertion efficiency factor YidD [Candidatus Methanomethylophilaceae archaeon]|nr:membrane protein insertion efficiency factor YidD [Candidatus Methanomethylophilaceae archaeon]
MIRRLLILPIRFYQKYLSGWKLRPTCRFVPTCSAYAIGAIEEWGAVRGLGLAIWRILRCNPFGKGGFDSVPKRNVSPVRLIRSAGKERAFPASYSVLFPTD